MNYTDANNIAEDLISTIAPTCEQGYVIVGGGLRRKNKDVHDIEILAKPILKRPLPVFGLLETFQTLLDKCLWDLEQAGRLYKLQAGPKKKKYKINLNHYGMQSLNGFAVEFYLATPPAQWGVEMVLRTGPGGEDDNFSRQCVTARSLGGFLPDGFRVRHLAVWSADQLDARGEPLKTERPIEMPEEMDFLRFLNLGWIEPQARHARWRRNGGR